MTTKATDRVEIAIADEQSAKGHNVGHEVEVVEPKSESRKLRARGNGDEKTPQDPDLRITILKPNGEKSSAAFVLGEHWRKLLRWSVIALVAASLLVKAKEILAAVQSGITIQMSREN
jgi:hypothetical protein